MKGSTFLHPLLSGRESSVHSTTRLLDKVTRTGDFVVTTGDDTAPPQRDRSSEFPVKTPKAVPTHVGRDIINE